MTDLEHALAAVAALEDVLQRERAAIARIDAQALEALAAEKREVAARLRPAFSADLSHAGSEGKRLHDALLRLRAEAEANRALIGEAIDAVAEARGLRQDTGTYDARARRRMAVAGKHGRGI